MAEVERSLQVNVPLDTAYNQWTQFEEFPRFMEGVHEVRQVDDRHLHWRAEVGGREEEWDAEITDQTRDSRVAWRSTSGAPNGGAVLFEPVADRLTKVTLRMEYEPHGIVENVGSALGFVGRRVEGDLERFKDYIESRGHETGSWRGEIHGSDVEHPGRSSTPVTTPAEGENRGPGADMSSSGLGGRDAGAYGESATQSRASSDFSREGEMERRESEGYPAADATAGSQPGQVTGATGGVAGSNIEGMGREYPNQAIATGETGNETSGYDERDMSRLSGSDYAEEMEEERRQDREEGLDRAA